jgi:hypothetical protein
MATITSNSAYVLHGSGTVANSNVREDLANVIFNVTPFKTPFQSSIAKTKATNDNHEWLTDVLRPSVSNNEKIEAEAITTGTSPGIRTRKGNYMQIATDIATVTKKAELMDKAGIPGKEMAYQLMKAGKELQMDVEKQLLSIQAKVAPTSGVAGRSATVASWILANQSVAGDGTANSDSTGDNVPTPGSNRTFSETLLTDIIDDVWDNSGDLDSHVVMANAAIVGKIRGFSGLVDSFDAVAAEGTIFNRVTIYQSQFGPLKVVPNKHMQDNTCYVLDTSTWALAYGGGKGIHMTDIATQASAETKLLETYYTLEARSEEANGGIYALTE